MTTFDTVFTDEPFTITAVAAPASPVLSVVSTATGIEGVAIPLTILATPGDATSVVTVVLSGYPAGTTFSAGTPNADGTWTMRGYRAFQTPQPIESGTWTATHDAERNEEVVTFVRQGTLPRAIIRIHATTSQLTFFALDGGGLMKNFLRGVVADDNNKDDPQIIFVPKQ